MRHHAKSKWSATCVNPAHLVPVAPTVVKVKPAAKRVSGPKKRPPRRTVVAFGEQTNWKALLGKYGVSKQVAMRRVDHGGMTLEEALLAGKPAAQAEAHHVTWEGELYGVNTLSDMLGISYVIFRRHLESGMTVEEAVDATRPIRRRVRGASSSV